MELKVFLGTAGAAWAASFSKALGAMLGRCEMERFPDGELCVLVQEDVRGADVVVALPLFGADQLFELLLITDACRRAGARTVSAVVPYLAYTRQDRRTNPGEPLAGPLFARLLGVGDFHRVFTVDLHVDAAEGWFLCPVEHLSAALPLADSVRPLLSPSSVVVSPDLGGAKRAERFADLLGCPVAVIHKQRRGRGEVLARTVFGDVKDKSIVVFDDLISTGKTLETAISAVRSAGCADDITVVTTHALLAPPAVDRLRSAGIRRLVAADSVPLPAGLPFPVVSVSLATLFADALRATFR